MDWLRLDGQREAFFKNFGKFFEAHGHSENLKKER